MTGNPEFNDIENKFSIKAKSKDDLNIKIILQGTFLINSYILELIALSERLMQPKKENEIVLLNDMKIVNSKLNTLSEFLPSAVIFDQNDLFSLDKNEHQRWVQLSKIIEYKQIATTEQIKQEFKKIVKAILIGNAMAAKGAEQKSSFSKFFFKNFSGIGYFLNSKKAEKKAHVFFADPDTETAISVWNSMEQSLTYQGLKVIMPSIKYCEKIYIDEIVQPLTQQYIKEQMQSGNLGKITPFSKPTQIIPYSEEYKKKLFTKDLTKIKIRILCSKKLTKPDPKVPPFKQIIIHVHGGGFVAMGTRSHQIYSRKWANTLNYPIFSIDYKKAPQHPYPEGINDIWQAYNWIINNAQNFFNIVPEKIVLVGDSAGGNLITSLTLLCIKHGIRVPDGIVPIYPALNCNINAFTPSYILALDDQILPHMFLKMCINSYIKSDSGMDPSLDFFISPVQAPGQFLKFFPKVRMTFGLCDPLNDDAFRFIEKLVQYGVDIKGIAYNDMPHGYLNYDVPGGMKYAATCVDDAANFMKEILN